MTITNIQDTNTMKAITIQEVRPTYHIVRATTERFGENEIMYEGTSHQDALNYIERVRASEAPNKPAKGSNADQLDKHLLRLHKMGLPLTHNVSFYGEDDWEQAFISGTHNLKKELLKDATEWQAEQLEDMELITYTLEIVVDDDATEFNVIIGDVTAGATYKRQGFPAKATILKMIEAVKEGYLKAL